MSTPTTSPTAPAAVSNVTMYPIIGYRDLGAEIVRPLADTPYGYREYTARDLVGNLWSFGAYRPATG